MHDGVTSEVHFHHRRDHTLACSTHYPMATYMFC